MQGATRGTSGPPIRDPSRAGVSVPLWQPGALLPPPFRPLYASRLNPRDLSWLLAGVHPASTRWEHLVVCAVVSKSLGSSQPGL
jgi:hypothetical protein